MKKLLFLMIFIPLASFSQKYSEVIDIPNKTANQLYSKANEWFALTFNSAKDVIQLQDPVEKKIIGKGVKQFSYSVGKYAVSMNMHFTLMVQFKDGKYKYDIQSSEINPEVGSESYTYELYKQMSTKEGLTEYFKEKNIKPWMVGEKKFQENIEANKLAVAEIEKQLHQVTDDLTAALKKESSTDNW